MLTCAKVTRNSYLLERFKLFLPLEESAFLLWVQFILIYFFIIIGKFECIKNTSLLNKPIRSSKLLRAFIIKTKSFSLPQENYGSEQTTTVEQFTDWAPTKNVFDHNFPIQHVVKFRHCRAAETSNTKVSPL